MILGFVDMINVAKILVVDCANVKHGEKVLVVTDASRLSIAIVLAAAARERDAESVIMVMPPPKVPGQEPSIIVAEAMKNAHVIFLPLTRSIAHTTATIEARKAGARVISMAEFTEEMMVSGGMEGDFVSQKPLVEKLAELLTNANTAEVESPLGTNITMQLAGRKGRALTGIAHEPGNYATPPDIEASIAPLEDTAEGVIMVDGSIAGIGLVTETVKLIVKKGKVVEILGGMEARKLKAMLEEAKNPNVYRIAELGIGLNPKAKLRGTILEDEGALGVIHIAVGKNYTFGGKIDAPIHIDNMLLNCTLRLDRKLVLRDGKLLNL